MSPQKILVIDNDQTTGRMLHRILGREHYRISTSRDSTDGLSQANKIRPDLVILELDLPLGSGFRVLELLWKWHQARIIVLTWRADIADKVRALDSGAYDYMVKPFSPEELAARVRVVLRSRPLAGQIPAVRSNLHVNMVDRQIFLDRKLLELTAKEEAVLFILARHAGRLVPQKRLLRVVWGEGASEISDLKNQIASLRSKLGEHSEKALIQGGGYFGYRLATTVTYDRESPAEELSSTAGRVAQDDAPPTLEGYHDTAVGPTGHEVDVRR